MAIPIQPQTGRPIAVPPPVRGARPPVFVAPRAPADPYATILAGLPRPISNAQITKQAGGEISPLVAAVTKTIGGQTQAAQNAIKGFTGDAAAKLAAIDWGAPYSQGEQGQAAVDSALQQSLAGAGSTDAAQLAQRLAVINDPTVAAAAGALTANGAANGTTQLAQGSASLGELLANAAGAQSYGQKLPGIQRLAGLQAIATAGQQGQAQIAAQAQQLEAQLPSIISGLQSRNDQRSQDIALTREKQTIRNDNLAAGQASAAGQAATLNERAGATTQTNQTKLQIATMNAEGKASAAQAAQARSDRSYRLQFAKTYKFDPVTNATLPGYTRTSSGTVVKVGSKTGQAAEYPNLSKAQVVHLRGGISSAFYGVPEQKDVNGKVTRNALPPVNYEDAITHAVKAGYSRAAATKMANRFYMPGQRGRPTKPANVNPATNPNAAGPVAP